MGRILNPIGQIAKKTLLSGRPLPIEMNALSNYYSTGKMFTLIVRMRIIEHHFGVLLSRDMKVLSSYYSTGIMLTPITQMRMT